MAVIAEDGITLLWGPVGNGDLGQKYFNKDMVKHAC